MRALLKGGGIHSIGRNGSQNERQPFSWDSLGGYRKINVIAAKFSKRQKVKESSHPMDSPLYFLIKNEECTVSEYGGQVDGAFQRKEVDLKTSTWRVRYTRFLVRTQDCTH